MAWRNLAYGSESVVVKDVKDSTIVNVPSSIGGKIYSILEFLRVIPLHRPVGVSEIYKHTGIDLRMDDGTDQRLRNNPKVNVNGEEYSYQAKYRISNKDQFLSMLDRVPDGIPHEDVVDCYVGIVDDIQELVRIGKIICIKNTEKAVDTYFARGFSFLTKLKSNAVVQPNGFLCRVWKSVADEVRRGDCVKVGERWYRVSTVQKLASTAVLTPEMTMNTMSSKSVSSIKDPVLTKKVKYVLPMDHEALPLDSPFTLGTNPDLYSSSMHLPQQNGIEMPLVKHGCTNDIRKLWLDTTKKWPTDRLSFERELVKAGLTTQKMVDANRKQKKPRARKSKTRKQRKQRAIKISNAHLVGTELGDLLTMGHGEDFSLGATQFSER